MNECHVPSHCLLLTLYVAFRHVKNLLRGRLEGVGCRAAPKGVAVKILVGADRLFSAFVGISVIDGLIILHHALLLLKRFLHSLRCLYVARRLIEVVYVLFEVA